jgi:hypothetical protein
MNTALNPNALPYAKAANLLTDAYNVIAGTVAAVRKLNGAVTEALAMRNRYYELNALSDASLQSLGVTRNAIPQIVATEAGLFTPNEVAPIASNNNEPQAARVA